MQEIKIINDITIAGKTTLFQELSEADRKRFAEALQDGMMGLAGYKRKTA